MLINYNLKAFIIVARNGSIQASTAELSLTLAGPTSVLGARVVGQCSAIVKSYHKFV